MWLGRVCVCVCVFVFVFGARAHSISICTGYFITLHLVVCAYPHSSWYECLMGETGINHTPSREIWDGKNDSTIGNEMVSEWTDSGKWDERKSVKVGNGMRSEWADSGTGSEWDGNSSSCGGTRNAGKEISNGRGRETSVGKRNIATVPVPVPFPYRPDHFSRPDLYRAEPCNFCVE